MAEIYGRKDGLCKGHRRLDAPDRRRDRLPGHVRDRRGRHPACDRRRVGCADPEAGAGRALLLRRRRLQAGRVLRVAEHRVALEAPDRLRDGEQRLQRAHAHRAGGREPRERRGPLRQGEGLQHARRHDRRARPDRHVRDRRRGGRRAPGPATARRSSSPRCTGYRRTATSSRRPACRCTSRSTRRSRSSARPRSTRRRRSGDPVPAFRGRLVADGTLSADDADPIAESVRRGDAGGGQLRPRQPVPRRRVRPRIRLRLGGDRHGTRASVHRGHRRGDPPRDGARRDRPLLRAEHGDDRERAVRRRVRQGPRARHADLRDGGDRDGDRRRARRLPAGGRALHGRVHARRDGPGDQRGAALPRDERRAGEGAARAEGGLRLHRRLGRAAHRDDRRALHGRARPEGRGAVHCGGREGADGDRDPRRQPGRLPAQLPAHARARRGPRRRVPRAVRRGGRAPRGRRRDDRRHRLDGRPRARSGTAARRRRDRGGGDRPAHARAARHADDPRVGRQDRATSWSSTRRRVMRRPRR